MRAEDRLRAAHGQRGWSGAAVPVSSASEAMRGGRWGLRAHGCRGVGVQSPTEVAGEAGVVPAIQGGEADDQACAEGWQSHA